MRQATTAEINLAVQCRDQGKVESMKRYLEGSRSLEELFAELDQVEKRISELSASMTPVVFNAERGSRL